MTRALQPARRLGRYLLLDAFASGGMAAVHFGQQLGPAGITRVVAIKRLHPHLVCEEAFVQMFLDEARMAMRIRHPNVVPVLDVLFEDNELFMVMEYVAGLALVRVGPRATGQPMPARIASALVGDVLLGLHCAHEATNESGEPLGLVHRDVSPHNVMVGGDGIARVIDFGIAKASGRAYATPAPAVKGKIAYMAPEQLRCGEVSPRSDLYSASVMLWECLTGRKLVSGDERVAVDQILQGEFEAPSLSQPELGRDVDVTVMRGLARDPRKRWSSAGEMAAALDVVLPRASALQVAAWMAERAGDALAEQAARVRAIESSRLTPAPAARDDGPAADARLALWSAPVAPSTSEPIASDTISIPPPTSVPSPASGPAPNAAGRPMRRWLAASAGVGAALAFGAVYVVPSQRASRVDIIAVDSAWPPPEEKAPPSVTLAETPSSIAPRPIAPRSAFAAPPRSGPALVTAATRSDPVLAAVTSAAPGVDASRRHDDECRVPFVIDDQGHRRYNRACLRP